MLVFKAGYHTKFASKNAEQLRTFSEYRMPDRQPERGEESVQATFTDEWNTVQQDELSFTYTAEDLKQLNRKVWLRWLDHARGEVQTVLNVGVGLGRESRALQEVTGAEIFGIDLNFAVLQSGPVFKANPRIHLVVASLFHIPFELSSFDLVYSQGVIHHTFSTAKAFQSIASYVRRGGYLFIWVYGLDDHLIRRGLTGLVTRANYMAEGVLRPLVSSSPKALRDIALNATTLVYHPLAKTRVVHKDKWNLKNTNHAMRDWLSPRYAYRHSYNEVFEWFEDLGFNIIDVQSPRAYRKLFQKQLWGAGVTGKRDADASPDSK